MKGRLGFYLIAAVIVVIVMTFATPEQQFEIQKGATIIAGPALAVFLAGFALVAIWSVLTGKGGKNS